MTTSISASFSPHRAPPSPRARWLSSIAQQWHAWQAARRAVRADERIWDMALQDARVMADLSRAMQAQAAKR